MNNKKELNKIFQIGFNKCGTRSIYDLFTQTIPKINTIHWDNGKLAYSIYKNNKKCIKLLNDYEDYTFFSDMECIIDGNAYFSFYHFKEFDEQYPNSKFILNVRNVDNWINSRLNHSNGNYKYLFTNNHFSIYHNDVINNDNFSTLIYTKMLSNIDKNSTVDIADIINKWKIDWYEHINDVKEYFKDRPEDLLVFDIEKDDISKIKDFFSGYLYFKVNNLSHIK